ncbi:MAG: hypothetical protein CM1200mP12_19670 [Gammaproteobacteria bacterium]|nr:MAG: hypothetical protein CM1200mP12_19670 [Gammaproteobacteria bacterium]
MAVAAVLRYQTRLSDLRQSSWWGLPIGVVAGSKRVMNTFSGADKTPPIFAGGTFSGNPLTMAGGLACWNISRRIGEKFILTYMSRVIE